MTVFEKFSCQGKRKKKKRFAENQFHHIFRLFDVFQFFLSPQVKQWVINTYKYGIYELPHELPNVSRVRILENYEISGKCLNLREG